VEVRHINRSSSATRQPEVDTGAKSEYELSTHRRSPVVAYISSTSISPRILILPAQRTIQC
jgi:hypothetical protein